MTTLTASIEGIGYWSRGLPSWDAACAFARRWHRAGGRTGAAVAAAAGAERTPPRARDGRGRAGSRAGRVHRRRPRRRRRCRRCSPRPTATCRSPTTCAARSPVNRTTVSPTRFHNSVHNAAAGYWTIGAGAMQPATAISAFDASFAQGLLEAMVQLDRRQRGGAAGRLRQLRRPGRWRGSRPATACSAPRWCCRGAPRGGAAADCASRSTTATPATARGALARRDHANAMAQMLPLFDALAGGHAPARAEGRAAAACCGWRSAMVEALRDCARWTRTTSPW